MKLTPTSLDRGIPRSPGKNWGEIADPLCRGLRIRTTYPAAGGRITRFYFRYRHRVSGQLKSAPLGTYPGLSLKEAREKVEHELRPIAEGGGDVGAELKRQAQQAHAEQEAERKQEEGTIASMVETFMRSERYLTLADGTRRSYGRYLEGVTAKEWASRQPDTVTRGEVEELFLSLRRKRGPRAAGHWLASASAFWTWMLQNEFTDRNPFLRTEKLRKQGAAGISTRALSVEELAALFVALADLAEDRARAVRLMLATGLRPSEVLRGEWGELAHNEGTWIIPAHRMKDRHRGPHIVFLSDFARAALPTRWPTSGLMFPSRAKAGNVQTENLGKQLARLGIPGLTPKVLRTTAATHWQRLAISPELRERMLHHSEKNPLARHYLHHDYAEELREAWQNWGRELERIEEGSHE